MSDAFLAISSIFSMIIGFLDSISVPGFNFSFLSLFIGVFAFSAIIVVLRILFDFSLTDSGSRSDRQGSSKGG